MRRELKNVETGHLSWRLTGGIDGQLLPDSGEGLSPITWSAEQGLKRPVLHYRGPLLKNNKLTSPNSCRKKKYPKRDSPYQEEGLGIGFP